MLRFVDCHVRVTPARAVRSLKVGLATSLLSLITLSAGDLDPQLKMVKRQWSKSRTEVMARLVAGGSMLPETARVSPDKQDVLVPATISLTSTEALDRLGIVYNRITPSIVTAKVPLSALEALEGASSIQRVAMAHRMELHNDINMTKMHVSVPHTAGYTGTDVLVGIVDSGIDVQHPAFRVGGVATGASRVKYLWDQTVEPAVPFTVGTFTSEVGRRWTDAEITAGTCTEVDEDGHGTHVAGSFAGYDAAYPARNGSAKNANILFVKTSFYSDDILNGVKWLVEQANALGKPVVINLSLGSSYGPHDGTDLDTKAMDDLVANSSGKLIVVRSGGNYANDGIHDSATVGVSGATMPFTVGAYTQSTTNRDWLQFDFYYDATAAVSVRVKDSAGNWSTWMAPAAGGYESTLPDGTGCLVYVADAVESYNPNLKNVFIRLGELASDSDGKHIRTGNWELEFRTAAGDTRLDGWLYDAAGGEIEASFTTPDPDITLGNGACGNNIITVAAYVSRHSWPASDGKNYWYSTYETDNDIATFSSIGPTRDNREKPDVTGGGANVLSTRSSDAATPGVSSLPADGTQYYRYMQGTSMSSPTVAGAVALLKESHPTWTYVNMINYFKTNSQGTTVHTTQGIWDKNWGWGVMDLTNGVAPSVSISASPAGPLQVNPSATVAFKATVANATNNTANWTVSAGGGSIAPTSTAGDGVAEATYTAPATVGTYTVTATSAEDPTKTAVTTVNVYDPAAVSVAVTPSTKTLLTGASFAFSAAATGAPSAGTFVWGVSTGGGSITNAGAYQAPTTAGTYTITATSSWGPAGTATVHVKTLNLNGDSAVDTLDVLQLTKRWGSTDPADLALADLDGSGAIGDADLTILLNAL